MQIVEVRNDILKLAYSPFQNGILLSDFLLVSEGTKSILAQVIGIESSKENDINIAVLKGCLSVDETGKINSYVGFTPSTGAEISPVTQDQVINMLCDNQDTVIWGYLAQHDNILFKTDKEILKNKPLILIDDYENYNVIVNNIVYSNKKLGSKTVLVDFEGSLKIDNAFYIKIGEDFKFPLSYNILDYIYENDLKEESLSTQAVVQDIIIELQEYIKTLKEGFLPFSTIKNVIYAQYAENKIPELMLLKNKFVKYSQQEIFAEAADDFDFINEAIEENDIIVIDATEIQNIWHKLVLNYLSKELSTPCTFITKLENDNSNKKTILDIYNNRIINPILASNYSHEFVNVMKSIAKNLILFPPTQTQQEFATYGSFIQKLNRDEYVICGENTLYLSFLVRLTYIDTNMSPDYIEKEIQKDVDKLYRAGAKKKYSTIEAKENILEQDKQSALSVDEQVSHSAGLSIEEPPAFTTDVSTETPTSSQIQAIEDEPLTDDDLDFIEELDGIPQDAPTETVSTQQEPLSEDTTEFEPLEEFTEIQPEPVDSLPAESVINNPLPLQDNTEPEEVLPEQARQIETVIPPAREEKTEKPQSFNDDKPIPPPQPIPVYSVPELEVESPVEFNEGNFVYHEKYGKGVIEKIMNYGNKTLCSIQFEEVGRRLLDPNLAGLKQI